MISITKASSTFGLSNGDNIKSLTPSQKSICIKSIMHVFTIIIRHTYRTHCANQAFIEGGLPKCKREQTNASFSILHSISYRIPRNLSLPIHFFWISTETNVSQQKLSVNPSRSPKENLLCT